MENIFSSSSFNSIGKKSARTKRENYFFFFLKSFLEESVKSSLMELCYRKSRVRPIVS